MELAVEDEATEEAMDADAAKDAIIARERLLSGRCWALAGTRPNCCSTLPPVAISDPKPKEVDDEAILVVSNIELRCEPMKLLALGVSDISPGDTTADCGLFTHLLL